MEAQAVQMIAYEEEKVQERVSPSHVALYGWIYVIFALLTALALYVMFAAPLDAI